MPAEKPIYKVVFHNQGQVFELFAGEVSQGGLFGFIEIGELLLDAKTSVVIDPSEDRLRNEFQGVRRFYVPMHAIIRIDEVESQGVGRVVDSPPSEGKVATFPMPIYTPKNKPE